MGLPLRPVHLAERGGGTDASLPRVGPALAWRTALRLLTLVCLLAGAALCAVGCADDPESQDPVVLTVNGSPVRRSDVRRIQAVARFSGEPLDAQEARRQATDEQLIAQEAERLGVTVGDERLDERMAELTAAVGGAEELNAELTAASASMAQLRAGVAVSLLSEALQDAKFGGLQATTADARRFYRENSDAFTTEAAVDLLGIAVRTERIAESVRDRILAGQPFGNAAAQFSIDPELKQNQGAYGWVTVDSLPDGVRTAIEGLDPGGLSSPVQVNAQWYVFAVADRQPRHVEPFTAVAEEVRAELTRRERAAALGTWVDTARQDAKIVVVDGV